MKEKVLDGVDIDSRWLGPHGIGRFAGEMVRRISFGGEVDGGLSPSHPLDVVALSLRMLVRPRRALYSPGFNAPLLGLRRYVLTVHDLNHIDIMGAGLARRAYYRLVLRRACRQAARVLTVSEFSRRRIVDWAGVPETQVVNVGNGVGEEFTASGDSHRPGYRYWLCVSNRKAHKNEVRMLRAFARAQIDPTIRLQLTGYTTPVLRALLDELDLAGRVDFIGQLDDTALAERYRSALALIFVSLYEGFGLPVVEAMSCGTPVLTSNVTALPEVAGDAALQVDPLSESAIAEGIERLTTDQSLARKYQQLGFERAREFAWDQVAQRVCRELLTIKH